MTITTKAMAKVAAVATGLAMATSMLSLAPMAHAQTMTTTTTTTCSVGTVDLTIGSTGTAVTCLQQALIAAGYSIPAGATGYFGAQTRAAVAAWQKAAGVAPAAGYFGAISRAHWSGTTTTTTSTVAGCAPGAMFSSTTGQSCASSTTVAGCAPGAMFSSTTGQACNTTTTTTLSGVGRLTNVSSLGDVTSDIKEGESAKQVVGVTADATGGDVAIQRVDATFIIGNWGSQSSNLDKYVSDVSLYLNGTKLASMDPAAGDKDGRTWTMRFAGLNGVVKSGQTGNLYVKITPVSSVGINETGKTVTARLGVDGVRAVGADGISETYITSNISQDFTVSTMTTGTLTVTESGDNPVASQVAVSSSTTSGVTLLSFNLKAKNQDVEITDLVASFNTSDNNLNDVVSTVKLMKGSTVLSSKTLSTGSNGTVTFTNIDQTISKDSTANYTIVADLKGDSSYADGTTLIASTTVSGWDVSDADGATVTPSSAVAGKTMTLTATGISVTKGTIPTPTKTSCNGVSGCGEVGTYTIPFTVTAGDSDIFIAGIAATSGTGTRIVYATTTTSTTATTNQGSANFSASNTVTGDLAGSYYKVLAGTSRTFTLTVAYTATATGFTGLQLVSIGYGTTNALGSTYTANLDTYKTDNMTLVKN